MSTAQELAQMRAAKDSLRAAKEAKLVPLYRRLGVCLEVFGRSLSLSPATLNRAYDEYAVVQLELHRVLSAEDEESRALREEINNRLVAIAGAVELIEELLNADRGEESDVVLGKAREWWKEYQTCRAEWGEENRVRRAFRTADVIDDDASDDADDEEEGSGVTGR